MVRHLALTIIGAIAGLALWLLARHWDDPSLSPTLYLGLLTLTCTWSATALALCGPHDPGRAMVGGLVLAAPVTLLVGIAGLRQVSAIDFLDDPVMVSMAVMLVALSIPFLSVWMWNRSEWRRYARLFDTAWGIAVRYAVAAIFVVVFWLIVLLSDALLKLVGLTFIDDIISARPAQFVLSGAVFGLGLAVVFELRQALSPNLILRLLRLLVPVVLAVVAIFLLAIPFSGLTRLFGDYSAAGTLMGVTIAAITLVSSALGRDDDGAVRTRMLRVSTRVLALVLPLLAVLPAWSVARRVGQYGWTPDRILASTIAALLLAYAAGYSVAVLRQAGWPARIRQVNVVLALAVIAVAALWMTPLLNVYRLSTQSQIARFEAGNATVAELPLWEMSRDWGRAGQAGLEDLEAMSDHPDHADLSVRIAAVRTMANPFQYEQEVARRAVPAKVAALAQLLPARPEGETVPAALLERLSTFHLDAILEGCRRSLPDGRNGCVFVHGSFSPRDDAARQGAILYLEADDRVRTVFLLALEDGTLSVREAFDPLRGDWPVLPPDTIADVMDGGYSVRPREGQALSTGGANLEPAD